MPDRFTKKLELYAPTGSDQGDIAQALSRRLRRALAEFGAVAPESVHISDTDGNRFERGSLAEARAALDEYGLQVKRISFDSRATDRTRRSSVLAGASVTAWYGYENTSNVDIDIWGYSKVHVDGLVAAVETLFERIRSNPSLTSSGGDAAQDHVQADDQRTAASSPGANSGPGAMSATVAVSTADNSAPEPDRPSNEQGTDGHSSGQPSWFRRTWRDHAAALLVSLVSAVLAGLILWAVLGHS